MKNINKVERTLISFDQQDIIKFEQFLKSSFFNRNKPLIELFKYFKRIGFEKILIKKPREIYRGMFGKDRKFSDRIFKRKIGEFLQVSESYLVQRHLLKNSESAEIFLLQELFDRALYDQFLIKLNALESKLNSLTIKDDDDYLNLYKITTLNYHYHSIKNSNNRYEEELIEISQLMSNYHQNYYLIVKLRGIASDLNQNALVQSAKNKLNDPSFIQLETDIQKTNIPLIKAYWQTIKFLSNQDNEASFEKLLNSLLNNVFEGKKDEKVLFDYVLNFCVLKINSGRDEYYQKLFYLHEKILNMKSFYIDGFLFADTVINIVTIALRCNETKWVEGFLVEYEEKIQLAERKNIINHCEALLNFQQKQYDKAWSTLNNVHYNSNHFKLRIYTLYIKIFFEHNEYDCLENKINAFSEFLRYNKNNSNEVKLSENQIKLYSEFVKKINILSKSNNKDSLLEIKIEISQTTHLAERMWLEEKVKEKLGVL